MILLNVLNLIICSIILYIYKYKCIYIYVYEMCAFFGHHHCTKARSEATYKTRVILRNLDFYKHPDYNAVSIVIFFLLCRENIFFGNFIKYYI